MKGGKEKREKVAVGGTEKEASWRKEKRKNSGD